MKWTSIFLAGLVSINAFATELTVTPAQKKIQHMLQVLESRQTHDARIKYIISQFAGFPYMFATGGNNPLYRLDGFDCQTFVQTGMALLYAKDLNEFDEDYLRISYGAFSEIYGTTATLFNRNHFVELDLNPINRRNGWFQDITSTGELAEYAKTIHAVIDRQNWFAAQGKKFPTEKKSVAMSYIPKELLVMQTAEGRYTPNYDLLYKIPTPSVVEIINDPHKWMMHGKHVKAAIGSELIVSHIGFLYRQQFKFGETIYHRINCGLNWQYHKSCMVTAIKCNKAVCNELMLAHATDEYPSKFYWYKQYGDYVCSPRKPVFGKYTRCNRVEQIPFFAYLTNYHYGSYWIMNNEALLGVHIEKLL